MRQIVWILWHDASFNQNDWTTEDAHHGLVHIETCGFLIREDKDVIHVGTDYDPLESKWRGVTTIPRGMIKRKKVLRLKE